MPSTRLCYQATPPLVHQDKLLYVPMSSSDGREMTHYTEVDHSQKLQGLYTTGLASCVALAIIKKNQQGDITHMAMCHFSGGISKQNLDDFIKRSEPLGTEAELIICGGTSYASSSFADTRHLIVHKSNIHHILRVCNIEKHQKKFKKMHVFCQRALCVTFAGVIGGFDYVKQHGTKHQLQRQISIKRDFTLAKEQELLTYLITDHHLKPQHLELLNRVKSAILHSKNLHNKTKSELLRLTRFYAIECFYNPTPQQDTLAQLRTKISHRLPNSKCPLWCCFTKPSPTPLKAAITELFQFKDSQAQLDPPIEMIKL